MRFGSKVVVTRGSENREPGTVGCLRKVRGILVFARGCDRYVRLLEDDPLAGCDFCTKKGDVGFWSASTVKLDK